MVLYRSYKGTSRHPVIDTNDFLPDVGTQTQAQVRSILHVPPSSTTSDTHGLGFYTHVAGLPGLLHWCLIPSIYVHDLCFVEVDRNTMRCNG